MTEQEMKEYVDSLERELYSYRKLGTQKKIKADSGIEINLIRRNSRE